MFLDMTVQKYKQLVAFGQELVTKTALVAHYSLSGGYVGNTS
jgi:hypothetical protein